MYEGGSSIKETKAAVALILAAQKIYLIQFFNIIPLQSGALFQSFPPLLEDVQEALLAEVLQNSLYSSLEAILCLETTSSKAVFQLGEEEKVTRGQIRRVRCMVECLDGF